MPLARARLPFLALGGVSLLSALWGGLIRLGWALPVPAASVPVFHGPLMVTGFLGTLIGLERAVAIKRPWAYGAPLFAGAGAVALLAGFPAHVGHALTAASSLVLVAIFVRLAREQPSLHLSLMGMAAGLWFAGTVMLPPGIPTRSAASCWPSGAADVSSRGFDRV